jgi:hypothetical protein
VRISAAATAHWAAQRALRRGVCRSTSPVALASPAAAICVCRTPSAGAGPAPALTSSLSVGAGGAARSGSSGEGCGSGALGSAAAGGAAALTVRRFGRWFWRQRRGHPARCPSRRHSRPAQLGLPLRSRRPLGWARQRRRERSARRGAPRAPRQAVYFARRSHHCRAGGCGVDVGAESQY